jgi:hypothetical protein
MCIFKEMKHAQPRAGFLLSVPFLDGVFFSLRQPVKKFVDLIGFRDHGLRNEVDQIEKLIGDRRVITDINLSRVDRFIANHANDVECFPSQRSLPPRGLRVYLYSTFFLTIAFIVKSMSFNSPLLVKG